MFHLKKIESFFHVQIDDNIYSTTHLFNFRYYYSHHFTLPMLKKYRVSEDVNTKRFLNEMNAFTHNFDDMPEGFHGLSRIIWSEKELQVDLNFRGVAATGRRVSLEPVAERSDAQLKPNCL